jgi:hypothetical protein
MRRALHGEFRQNDELRRCIAAGCRINQAGHVIYVRVDDIPGSGAVGRLDADVALGLYRRRPPRLNRHVRNPESLARRAGQNCTAAENIGALRPGKIK